MILVPVKESLSFGRVSDFTITNVGITSFLNNTDHLANQSTKIWFYSSAFFLL